MPLALSDLAVETRKLTIWLEFMCPYLARSHSTIFCGLPETHGPPLLPPLVGIGLDGGVGGFGAGVRNTRVELQPLELSPSLARTRQKWSVPSASWELLKVVSPVP